MFYARGYLARFIFSNNAPDIAVLFGFLTVAIFFRTIYSIISRWFYAQKDTVTPLAVSVFVILLNIVLVYILSKPSAYGLTGLAIAQSLVATVEVVILAGVMIFRDRGLLNLKFWGGIARIVSVAGFTLLAGFIMISIFPLGGHDLGAAILVKLGLISGVVLAVHVAISALFGLEEVRPVFKKARAILFKSIGIPY
jgi:putative peptidoglycan lipid II flippase